MNSGSFAALMCKIVGKYPPGFKEYIVGKAMISMGRIFFMFFLQPLRQKNPVLFISVRLVLPAFPFVVTGSVYVHDLTKETYWISGSECFDDFKFFSLPVTNSLAAPTPFTQYPFFNLSFSISSFATISRRRSIAVPQRDFQDALYV